MRALAAALFLSWVPLSLIAQQSPVDLDFFADAPEVIESSGEQEPEDTPRVPRCLVERIRTVGEKRTRVSLFDNGVAVVTIRQGDQQVFFRKCTLDPLEFKVYLEALEGCADQAGRKEPTTIETSSGNAEVRLSMPGDQPRSFEYSLFQVPDLSTAHLLSLLDDLEHHVSSMRPSAEQLRTWEPEEGQRVELYNGSFARITEVREDGVIVLEEEETLMSRIVPRKEWPDVIFRLVE